MIFPDLRARETKNAHVEAIEDGWCLRLDQGESNNYRLAQLDNNSSLNRKSFPYKPPFHLKLRARASQTSLPGTWGFGLWNDPFGLSLGSGATRGRLPTLPNTAWFFFASKENYLSFTDRQVGNGAMAAVFRSPLIPTLFLLPALITLPLLKLPTTSRWLRKQASALIDHNAASVNIDLTEWHFYSLSWETNAVIFSIDGNSVFESKLVPQPPLALVLWIDNQFAAWRPDGRVGYGILPTSDDSWVEITNIEID